jgi:hypothetical protein
MPHPFFDAIRFPWHRDEAKAMHYALFNAVSVPARYTGLYEDCGPDPRPLSPGLPADAAWREILDNLTVAQRLSRLCDMVLARADLLSTHQAIRNVQNAPDLLWAPLLREDNLVFIDRRALRLELQKLGTIGGSQGVLLVRGPSGCGKSWSELLVADMATSLGARCVYVFEGLVSTVQEVIAQLFTALNEPNAVTSQLTTEDAWFRQVCLDLQALAQKKDIVCWVVADDLGNDANGPRLDPQIRKFFDQFALTMANPAFAKWFRLVLLDYPEGDVPTKWKANVWLEDRPAETDVDENPIVDFLRAKADQMKKQMGADTAKKVAADILSKVDAPQPAPPPGTSIKPRLRRIHDELVGVLAKL